MRTDGWSRLVDIETRLAELLDCDGLAEIRGNVGFIRRQPTVLSLRASACRLLAPQRTRQAESLSSDLLSGRDRPHIGIVCFPETDC